MQIKFSSFHTHTIISHLQNHVILILFENFVLYSKLFLVLYTNFVSLTCEWTMYIYRHKVMLVQIILIHRSYLVLSIELSVLVGYQF